MTMFSFSEFADKLRSAFDETRARNGLLTIATHISPDPDAIGSAFSLALLGRGCGLRTSVFLSEPLPLKYRNLVGEISWSSEISTQASDMLLVVDTATRRRVGEKLDASLPAFASRFNLDHHISNEAWAETNHVDGDAAASAVLVFQLYRELEIPLDANAANLLYGGVLDDTGSFCFSNTNVAALQCAAQLVSLGAEPERVANTLYFSVPERILKLQSKALQSLRVWLDGGVSILAVNRAELQETGCSSEDTEGLVDIARRVEGVLVAVFLRELDGKWKASFRSKDSAIDVNNVAATFGGGGHAAAAGATIEGTQDEVEAKIKVALEAAFKKSHIVSSEKNP